MLRLLKDKKGIALILFLALLLMLTLVGVVAINNSLTNVDISGNRAESGNLMYAAEAGVEKAFVRIRDYYDHNLPIMPLDSLPTDSFVLGNDSVGYYTICDSSAGGCDTWFANARVFASSAFRRISAWSTGHIIISEAWTPGLPNKAAIRQQVAVYHIPVFQFSAIYDTLDLEISPEQAYDTCFLNGRIHTNKNLYIENYSAGATVRHLCLQNNITAKGAIFHGHLYNNGSFTGWPNLWGRGDSTTVHIRDFGGNYQLMKVGGKGGWLQHNYSLWVDSSWAKWGGTVEDSSHKISDLYLKLVVPKGRPIYDLIKRRSSYSMSFDSLADLRIYTNPGDSSANCMGDNDSVWIDIGGGDYHKEQFYNCAISLRLAFTYDYRQKRRVDACVVDIGQIAAYSSAALWPDNGIIYVTRHGSDPNTLYAVMIANAATLRDSLTIVSDRPVYIVGDFNTVSPKYAAIIADAVTIVSNPACTTWTVDSTLIHRPAASNITVNACIMTGNKATTKGVSPARYSGGLWNLVRLLENWSNRTLTINGSMACFWRSQVANSDYRFPGYAVGDSVYVQPSSATPSRPFNLTFDTRLCTAGAAMGMPPTVYLPPRTPVLNLVMKTNRKVYTP